jgi:hypothetical protein
MQQSKHKQFLNVLPNFSVNKQKYEVIYWCTSSNVCQTPRTAAYSMLTISEMCPGLLLCGKHLFWTI